MIVVGELFYFTISVDAITEEDARKIMEYVIELRGTRSGMSLSFSDPIV